MTTATSDDAERHDRHETGRRQRLAAPHGPLHAEPAQVAAGAEHDAAADGEQRQQRAPAGDVERIDELAHGDAAGEQAERRADPGQERPLVGEREPVVGLGALVEVDLPPPRHGVERSQDAVTVPAMDSRLAGAVVFVASGAVLVLEILAGRLLAPYVGVSLETFTGIIGVVLAGIATGTWLGGWMADRIDPRRLLPGALVLGGVAAIAAVPIVRALGPSIRSRTRRRSCSSPPLGVLRPVGAAQRQHATRRQDPARRARPHRPRRRTAVGAGDRRLARRRVRHRLRARRRVRHHAGRHRSRVAARRRRRRAVGTSAAACRARAIAAGALLAVVSSGVAVAAGPPCDVETAYYCADVRTDPAATDRARRSSSTTSATPTSTSPTRPTSSSPTCRSSATSSTPSPPPGEPIDAVHLGGGGFTVPRYLAATPTRARRASCSSSTPASSTSPRTSSASSSTRTCASSPATPASPSPTSPTDSADLVVGDAFGGRAVPWHLTTTEFASDIQRVLRDGGIYAQNIIDQPPLDFLRAEVATLRDVFDHVAVIGPPGRFDGSDGGNTIVVASDQPLPLDAHRRAQRRQGRRRRRGR